MCPRLVQVFFRHATMCSHQIEQKFDWTDWTWKRMKKYNRIKTVAIQRQDNQFLRLPFFGLAGYIDVGLGRKLGYVYVTKSAGSLKSSRRLTAPLLGDFFQGKPMQNRQTTPSVDQDAIVSSHRYASSPPGAGVPFLFVKPRSTEAAIWWFAPLYFSGQKRWN